MSEENKQVLNEKTLKKVTVSPAQLRYATTLFYLGLASFIIMLVTYFLYVSGRDHASGSSGGNAETVGAQIR